MFSKNFTRALIISLLAIVAISLANNLPTIIRQEPIVEYVLPPQPNFELAARIGLPAVVSVVTKTPVIPYSYYRKKPDKDGLYTLARGSGVLYTSDGYILTNSHVIQKAHIIIITLDDGREYQATLIGDRPEKDLAILKIDAVNLPFLKLGNSNKLVVGQPILVIGNPYGFSSTVTAGIISHPHRDVQKTHPGIVGDKIKHFIQVDASINPGNSGGALIDLQGNLIGIPSAGYTKLGESNGLGFAIPEEEIRQTIRSITNQIFL